MTKDESNQRREAILSLGPTIMQQRIRSAQRGEQPKTEGKKNNYERVVQTDSDIQSMNLPPIRKKRKGYPPRYGIARVIVVKSRHLVEDPIAQMVRKNILKKSK